MKNSNVPFAVIIGAYATGLIILMIWQFTFLN